MRIIVDANIVFSAILNSNSRIGQVLLNADEGVEFIAPDFLLTEIHRHHQRICSIMGISLSEVLSVQHTVCSSILFISEEQIPLDIMEEADRLVSDIDPRTLFYIALANYFNCNIWSGDSKLIKGLHTKGFTRFVTMDDIISHK
jgi:predicted nucleic acid-binding protein